MARQSIVGLPEGKTRAACRSSAVRRSLAMTIRIAAGFLSVLAVGLIAAPVETSARGGGFAGGHGMSFRGGFRAPMIRPAIARPQRVAVPARIRTAPFAHFRHAIGPRRVWVGAPWYGYDGVSTYVVPDEQSQPVASPTTEPPRRLGCSAQTYKVPSEAGGETSVKVWGC
jgi:hypothetical protein